MTPRKWSLFSTETCNSSFFGSWNLLAETQSSWPFPPRRPPRCFDTRRNETAVIVVVVPAAAWRLSAQTKSWPKLNDLNRLDLRILQKQNANKSVKHSFQRNPQQQKIPFGYGDSFRSPLWLLSCRPLFQGQLSWRYPASTSVPCARWTGESRAFCLGRNSHFVEMVRKVICWN